jgi:hypothetical protein
VNELVVPFAHLNAKDKSKTFARTAPSALNEIRDIVEAQDAHVVYENNQNKFRNLKQVQNMKQYMNNQKRMVWNDIYNSVLLNLELNCIKSENIFLCIFLLFI